MARLEAKIEPLTEASPSSRAVPPTHQRTRGPAPDRARPGRLRRPAVRGPRQADELGRLRLALTELDEAAAAPWEVHPDAPADAG